MELDCHLIPKAEISTHWIKHQRVKLDFSEEGIEEELQDVGFGRSFFDVMPKTQATEAEPEWPRVTVAEEPLCIVGHT